MEKHSTKVSFNSSLISTCNTKSLLNSIINSAHSKQSTAVAFLNVHMLIESHLDDSFKLSLNKFDYVLPDGMPIVFLLKYFFGINQERIAGMDLMPELLSVAEKKCIKVFFFGNTPENLDLLAAYLKKNYPALLVGGYLSPPFIALDKMDLISYANEINASGAGLVFVSLGCPKQEKWIFSMLGKVNGVMLGVGNAFLTTIGIDKRAPLWMQNVGLEWLFRLYLEPRRLFMRYLVTNSLFFKLCLMHLIKKIRRE